MPPATMLPPSDQSLTIGLTSSCAVGQPPVRRKTPSELRQEQLKRNVRLKPGSDGEQTSQGSSDPKKVSPRLVDTRVADIFAATKPHERPKLSLSKQMDDVGQKPLILSRGTRVAETGTGDLPRSGPTNGSVETEITSRSVHGAHSVDRFRGVTEMSAAVPAQAVGSAVNMVEALKMMAPITGQGLKESAVKFTDPVAAPHTGAICKSRTPPVDLSLKLSVRFLSADSLLWCHRTSFANEVEGLSTFVQHIEGGKQDILDRRPEGCAERQILQRFGAHFCQALFSWVHPPPQYSGLYDIALASTRGDTRKDPQLAALYQMWEDSFSSLYYMFRQGRCNQFYYCTQQFVVIFVGGGIAGREKNASNAFWSRSTRGLRRLLKEHCVEFLMPFSSPESDTTTVEELQELTEFEQLHPGQTRQLDSSAVLDNSALSLLVFEGKNVHRLFDFLLNYRYFVGSTKAKEFPTLYSPVEFKAATLYAPEVKCKKAEYDTSSKNEQGRNINGRSRSEAVTEMMYSLELKDPSGAYIPPWVIERVCKVLQESQGSGFEASLNTGPLTEILNAAYTLGEEGGRVPGVHPESKERETRPTDSRDIPAEVLYCKMKAVKQLKFSGGMYETSNSFR
ncbi:hypothetical protein R1flu_013934 [Riccia fluitans]|uniref:Uncharacterized protein n=1 Tax=Riccia fluitans TaxID=41844 RepID=A0ABD1YET9_9MARC